MKKKKKVIALKVRIVVNSKGKRREGNEEGTHAGCFRRAGRDLFLQRIGNYVAICFIIMLHCTFRFCTFFLYVLYFIIKKERKRKKEISLYLQPLHKIFAPCPCLGGPLWLSLTFFLPPLYPGFINTGEPTDHRCHFRFPKRN